MKSMRIKSVSVSVIVPIYKVEQYIRRCIDSILEQTFSDFELILVDDGSPDNCGAICDEYAKQDPRIRVIHKENGGLSSARNAGIRDAQGRYVMFCDSDDYVAPNWCQVMYEAIYRNPNAFIVSDLFRVSRGQIRCRESKSTGICKEISYFQLYKLGISAYAVNKIYDLSVLRENGLSFDENCRYAEDVAFNVSYCKLCDCVMYVDQPLYYYIQNDGSIMNRYYTNLFDLHIPLYWARLPLIKENELGEYCDIWLYHFQQLFRNAFDERNPMTFLQKMRYNHRMMNTKEFRHCLSHAAGEKENLLVLKVLRTHNYYLYYLFFKLVQFKQKLRRNGL